jgi:hypothetical protein
LRRLAVIAAALAALAALALPGVAAARPAPVTWCGTDEVTANRVPDLEVSSTDQIRFIYAIPADAPDNFLANASGIATDAAWIDQWWQGQDPTRTPRFDRYPFPGCTTTFGALDIGFLRLPDTSASYASEVTPAFRLVGELASTFGSNEKTIIYYDGPTQEKDICGETDFKAETSGGREGMAFIYLQSECGLTPGAGSSAEVAAHELAHNLGAVANGAPNACPNDTSHVCDSTTDLLYPFLSDGSNLDRITLDVGRNDYYGHAGSWFDIQDSAWLEHLPQFPLTVAATNHGTVQATAGDANLGCDVGCTAVPVDNSVTVQLQAVPAPGFVLTGWSGACSGSSTTCSVSMTQAQSVAATFGAAPVRLTASVGGRGRVVTTPSGIACPGACAHAFPSGKTVVFTAKPAKGWKLSRWTGACTGHGRCAVAAINARSVRAVFVRT